MTSDATQQLSILRQRIDNIDAALIYMLAERFRCTNEVGHLKAATHLPACDPAREAEQIQRLKKLAEDAGLDMAFTKAFFTFLVGEVVAKHKIIARQNQAK
ncbi:chorismate mutase [Bombella sp. ESL0385]|uniref:chorismate mutase n=2 Tax=Acetobacteraceae TaxID=433 RepID=A0ABT3WJI2_9PROT|nr:MULTISPECIES: chorismate mutase [Bombella]MCX5619265.1 chorismate mutase [Bombella pollinis]MUG90281.1 chorismate mutase [Bombella sp. ESL0385]